MLALVTGSSTSLHAQPAAPGATPHYETKPRLQVLLAGATVAATAMLSGSILLVVAADRADSRDDQLAKLEGSPFYKCAPGTPYQETCAEAQADAEAAATMKPIGGGLLAGGAALAVMTLLVTFLVPERVVVDGLEGNVDAAQPSLSLRPALTVSRDFTGIGLMGRF